MHAHETDRAGALAWLAGRMHFEALLADLHDAADRAAGETPPSEPDPVEVEQRPARAA